jgi:AraC-like DNA-binding protein
MSKNTLHLQAAHTALSQILALLPHRCYLKLDTKNDFVLPHNWGFENRRNPNFHLAYVRSGDGWYILGNHMERLTRGKIIIASPQYAHSRILRSDHSPHLVLTRFSLLAHSTDKPYPWDMPPFGFALVPRDPLLFHALFGQLQRTTSDAVLDAQRYSSILTTLLYTCCRELQDSYRQQESSDLRMEKALAFMRQHLHKNITMTQLAQAADLSPNYFREQFRSHFGKNPHRYFIEMKIKRATEWLTETDESIKDIAAALGYCDPFAFSKQFKAVTGVAPSALKRDELPHPSTK